MYLDSAEDRPEKEVKINNFIKQSIIAHKWQQKMVSKLIRRFKKDKSFQITMVHDSIIILKSRNNEQ